VVLIYRDNCLVDIQSDGPLLSDTHFGAFCQKTLWFIEIRPQDTAARLQPVEERELYFGHPVPVNHTWVCPQPGLVGPIRTRPDPAVRLPGAEPTYRGYKSRPWSPPQSVPSSSSTRRSQSGLNRCRALRVRSRCAGVPTRPATTVARIAAARRSQSALAVAEHRRSALLLPLFPPLLCFSRPRVDETEVVLLPSTSPRLHQEAPPPEAQLPPAPCPSALPPCLAFSLSLSLYSLC